MNTRMTAAALAVLLFGGCAAAVSDSSSAGTTGARKQAVAGNIHPAAIQVDGPAAAPPGADLYADAGTPLNAGATADWVVDGLNNTGQGCLGANAIATCVEPGITGAEGGAGHWNGVRIVDGIGGGEQDIFLTGGKENLPGTWNIGPGTVGSSKYDMVQAYLANNQTELFFGMERRGNNGTTAFDFEFNQVPPMTRPECPQNPQVPCRTEGDVLFTFEMQGSGGSGSAAPYVFTWNGSAYVGGASAAIKSAINNSTTTEGGPWGHVNSHGDWVLGALERFTFAEATAPLSLLPGIDACGGKAWVQVRTRSSATVTSDLKDTTRVFEFVFLGLQANAELLPSCDGGINYRATAQGLDGTAVANPNCAWTFSNGATSDACEGFLAVPAGTYGATVEVADPALPECGNTLDAGHRAAYDVLGVAAQVVPTCELTFGYEATPSGGADPADFIYAWTFTGDGTASPATSTARSGTVTVGNGRVNWEAAVLVQESRDGLTCEARASAAGTPFAPLELSLLLQGAAQTCPSMSSDAVTYDAVPSGGDGVYTLNWTGPSCSGLSCTIDPAEATYCFVQTVQATVGDTSGLCGTHDSETETYSKVTTVTATDL